MLGVQSVTSATCRPDYVYPLMRDSNLIVKLHLHLFTFYRWKIAVIYHLAVNFPLIIKYPAYSLTASNRELNNQCGEAGARPQVWVTQCSGRLVWLSEAVWCQCRLWTASGTAVATMWIGTWTTVDLWMIDIPGSLESGNFLPAIREAS